MSDVLLRIQFGSEEQKERFLPRLAKGEMVGCFVSGHWKNSQIEPAWAD